MIRQPRARSLYTLWPGFLRGLMFRLIGEPQISAWTREGMAADLRSAGFVVREDSGMADWNDRFAHGQAKVERGSYMRIAIARTWSLAPLDLFPV